MVFCDYHNTDTELNGELNRLVTQMQILIFYSVGVTSVCIFDEIRSAEPRESESKNIQDGGSFEK